MWGEPGPFGQQWRLGLHLHSVHPPHRGRVKGAQHHLSSYYHRAEKSHSVREEMWIRVSMLPAASKLSPATPGTAACVQGQLCGLDLGCQEYSCRRKHLARSPAGVPCFLCSKSAFNPSGSPWCLQEPLLCPTQPLADGTPTCWLGFLSLHLFAPGLAGL